MHPYSIDKDLREKVVIGLFVISILMTMTLKSNLSNVLNNFDKALDVAGISSTVEWMKEIGLTPELFTVTFWFSILDLIWNNFLWKFPIVRSIHGIPNLSGKWEGTLTTSFNKKDIPMKMEVRQTWKKISFICEFTETKSKSYSNVAAIYVEGVNGVEISFGFKNESKDNKTRQQQYNGYNILELKNGCIDARYFNNRPNPNHNVPGGNIGTFQLKRAK